MLPYAFFVPWLLQHGLNSPLLLTKLLSTRLGAFFGTDVIVSAIALLVFIRSDRRWNKVQRLWAPIIETLCVGVSFGLPLYLSLRERTLEIVDSEFWICFISDSKLFQGKA